MFMFRGGGYANPGSVSLTELEAHLGRWRAWTNKLLADGKLVTAQPLTYPAEGTVIRGTDKLVTDGPYAETKDLVSGIVVVEAASLAEATVLAKGCPILEHADGSVEVRPILERGPG